MKSPFKKYRNAIPLLSLTVSLLSSSAFSEFPETMATIAKKAAHREKIATINQQLVQSLENANLSKQKIARSHTQTGQEEQANLEMKNKVHQAHLFYFNNSTEFKLPDGINPETILACDVKIAIALLRTAIETDDAELATKVLRSGSYNVDQLKSSIQEILNFKSEEEGKYYLQEATIRWKSFSQEEKEQTLKTLHENYTNWLQEKLPNIKINTGMAFKELPKDGEWQNLATFNYIENQVTIGTNNRYWDINLEEIIATFFHERGGHEILQRLALMSMNDLDNENTVLFALSEYAQEKFNIRIKYNAQNPAELIPNMIDAIIMGKMTLDDLEDNKLAHLFITDMLRDVEERRVDMSSIRKTFNNQFKKMGSYNHLENDGAITVEELMLSKIEPQKKVVKKIAPKKLNQTPNNAAKKTMIGFDK